MIYSDIISHISMQALFFLLPFSLIMLTARYGPFKFLVVIPLVFSLSVLSFSQIIKHHLSTCDCSVTITENTNVLDLAAMYEFVSLCFWLFTVLLLSVASFLTNKIADKLLKKKALVVVIGCFTFSDLTPGEKYTIISKLVYSKTNECVLLNDENVTQTKTFIANSEGERNTDTHILMSRDDLRKFQKNGAVIRSNLYHHGKKIQTKECSLWEYESPVFLSDTVCYSDTWKESPKQKKYEQENSEKPKRIEAPKETQKAEKNAENTRMQ